MQTSILTSSVSTVLAFKPGYITWCSIICIQLIQNKNLEIFQAVPQKINLENFRAIQLGLCDTSQYDRLSFYPEFEIILGQCSQLIYTDLLRSQISMPTVSCLTF